MACTPELVREEVRGPDGDPGVVTWRELTRWARTTDQRSFDAVIARLRGQDAVPPVQLERRTLRPVRRPMPISALPSCEPSRVLSGVRVLLTPKAHSTLDTLIRSDQGPETGGLAFTLSEPRTLDTVRLTDVTGPGPNARLSPDEFIPDGPYDFDQIQRLQTQGRFAVCHGHSEPEPAYPGWPSSADRRLWQRFMRDLDRSWVIGLIAVTRPNQRMVLQPWVVSRATRYRDSCQPAVLL
jgi:hypothetical protein